MDISAETGALVSGVIAARRLRTTAWAIAQTTLAAALAWYISRDLLGHPTPFFAPIAAAVCLWSTNVVRAELAAELMIGVAIGIGVGTGVHAVCGAGPSAMAIAVALALSAAVFIGRGFIEHRPMFVNQTVVSAILILAFPQRGFVLERLFDALIGGGLAVAFSIVVFPKNPLAVLRGAQTDVQTALHDTLYQIGCRATEPTDLGAGWAMKATAGLHQALARLTDARNTARQLAKFCPRRWPLRSATHAVDRQAARLSMLTSSTLYLVHTVSTAADTSCPIAEELRAAINDLAAATAGLPTADRAATAAHAASARRHTAALSLDMPSDRQLLLAATIDTCADELDQLVQMR